MEAISLNASKLQGASSTITKKVEDIMVKTTSAGNGGQNSVDEANSYNKYDTLEITKDYLEYKTKSENSAVQSDVNQLNTSIPQIISEKPPQEASDAVLNVANTQTAPQIAIPSADESISANQLSSYSVSELKSLVLEGKITTEAYNTEIKSRTTAEETTTKEVTTTTKPASTNQKEDTSIVF